VSTASTWFSGVVMNIVPSLTIAVTSWPSATPVDSVQTGSSWATLSAVI